MFQGEKPHREKYEGVKKKKEQAEEEREQEIEALKDIYQDQEDLSAEDWEKLRKTLPLAIRKTFRTIRKMMKSDEIDRLEQKLEKLKEEGREEAEELNEKYEQLKKDLNIVIDRASEDKQAGIEKDEKVTNLKLSSGRFNNYIEAYNHIAEEIVRFEIEELGMMPIERDSANSED